MRVGAGRRHRRGHDEEPRRQLDNAQLGLPRGDRRAGRRARDHDGSGRRDRLHFQGAEARPYVYHCATPIVAQHIANGMYGMILVEPEEGLAPVDREFYVMQGEIYTEEAYGSAGELTESYRAWRYAILGAIAQK